MTLRSIQIGTDGESIQGDLRLPDAARCVVLFAHGSGSSRQSTRNQFVAHELNRCGLGTLLIDLLTPQEQIQERYTFHLRFDIGLLADRLRVATDWLLQDPDCQGHPISYFGASTGAAAALVASTSYPQIIRSIVSRGGRPDLAGEALTEVRTPALLIVGSLDKEVIELNREAVRFLRCETKLAIVPGATHLFEEPGTLEAVSSLASDWFLTHLYGQMP